MLKLREILTSPVMGEYVVFDLETTGMSKQDEIVEFAAVRCTEDGTVLASFEAMVKPSCPMTESARNVNGITDEMLSDKPDIKDVLPEFVQFLGQRPLVGHNVNGFDLGFLNRACHKVGLPEVENAVFDTLPFARRMMTREEAGGSYSVSSLVWSLGLTERPAHRAMNDVLMEADVYQKLRAIAKTKEVSPLVTEPPKKKDPVSLTVTIDDEKAMVAIDGYFPELKDIVRDYGFRWKKNQGTWQILIEKPVQKNVDLFCEAVKFYERKVILQDERSVIKLR